MQETHRKILDHPLITEVLFYPVKISEKDVPSMPGGEIVHIPVNGDTLGAYLYKPQDDAPVMLFFHGNGEIMIDYLYGFHHQVRELGLNFMVVDYRGYGLSTGSPSLSRLLEDARAAFAHATQQLGIDPSRMVVMGRSLGSLAALEIVSGAGRDVRGLIIESGIARFEHWIGRMSVYLERLNLDVELLKQALIAAFNHEQKIKAAACPVLIMHAPNDEIVSVEHGRNLAEWSDPGRTTLPVFPRGGHNDIQYLNQEEYFTVVKEFVSGLF